MGSSTVKGLNVVITADLRGLTSGFKKAESKMKSFGSRVDKFGRSLRNSFSSIFAIGGTGAAIVAPFVSFESQMNRVKGITGLAGKEFDRVRQKALELGRTTELTATEAAKGFVQLFKKGQTLEQGLTGIDTVLGLVTAGELNAAEASKIASAAFKVFGKTGESFVSLGDKMAKTSLKSGADIKDFGLLISKAGNEAVNAGVDFSELSAAFGVLRNGAVEASEAATALRNIMQRVSGRSAKALKVLDDLDLNFFDDAGRFVGFAEAMERFNKATANLNPKQIGDVSKVLFGSRAAGKALGLASAVGDIKSLKAEVDGAKGTLIAFRKALLEGLPGAIKLMVSAIEVAAIALSDSFSKELIIAANGIKDFATFVSNLSPTVKRMTALIVGLGAALVLAAVFVGTLKAALSVLFIGTILKFALNFVWVIGTALVNALIAAKTSTTAFAVTARKALATILLPLTRIAAMLFLIPAGFFAVIIAIEKLSALGSFIFEKIFTSPIKFAVYMLGVLTDKIRDLAKLLDKKGLLTPIFAALGLSKEQGLQILVDFHNQVQSSRDLLTKFGDDMKKGMIDPFKALEERAEKTRIGIGEFIKEITGFDFSKIGEMIFGGGDDKPKPTPKPNNDKSPAAEADKASAAVDGLNEKLQGKSNGFTEFMGTIAGELQKFSESLGSVQMQIAKIMVSSIQAMATGIGEIFAQVIIDGKSFFKSAKDAMKSFARSFIKQIIAMIAQLLILSAAQALFNALSKPVGGQAQNSAAVSSGAAFAAQATALLGGLASGFASGQAAGGSVFDAGGKSERRSFGNDFGGDGGIASQKKTTQTIILELDGRQITKSVVENLPSVVRTGSGTLRSS